MKNEEQLALLKEAEKFKEQSGRLSRRGREAFRVIRRSSSLKRNAVLRALARNLRDPAHRKMILEANEEDLKNAAAAKISSHLQDRLRLDETRLEGIAGAVDEIESLPDPVGEIVSGRNLPNGIEMIQKRVPLGVIFTVFESRPNVTIDVGALCLKAGNAAILRGGREALRTNRALHSIFQEALKEEGLPADGVLLVEDPDRALMLALLQEDRNIDLVVPRGGEGLIRFVNGNSLIPVVKHDKGVCNMYIDIHADPEVALSVTINAKLHRPSVCNAIENLVIHESYPGTSDLLKGLKAAGVELLGCEKTRALFPDALPIQDPEVEYNTEYLDHRLSVKMVPSLEEALGFIQSYSSGHSEAIISENKRSIDLFLSANDSAALFVNCSTRFHDGGQMGMGAEVGISTQRLHVRGPMGLRDLTTTTYLMIGEGQIRK